MTQHLSFRASAVLQRRLDQLAKARGLNRSRAIQAAILEATMPDAEGVPSEAEVLELLGESARAGNVAAMKGAEEVPPEARNGRRRRVCGA